MEELTVKDGAVQQSNFNDYQVLRMSDLPEIHTRIIATEQSADRHGRDRRAVRSRPAIANAFSSSPASGSATCRCRRNG